MDGFSQLADFILLGKPKGLVKITSGNRFVILINVASGLTIVLFPARYTRINTPINTNNEKKPTA
jgi:hypothetical protein